MVSFQSHVSSHSYEYRSLASHTCILAIISDSFLTVSTSHLLVVALHQGRTASYTSIPRPPGDAPFMKLSKSSRAPDSLCFSLDGEGDGEGARVEASEPGTEMLK